MTLKDRHLKTIFYYTSLLISSFMLFSCYAGKKAETKNIVTAAKKNVSAESVQQAEIAGTRETKLSEEKIDTSIYNKIQSKLSEYSSSLDSVKSALNRTEQLLNDNKSFRKNYNPEVIRLSTYLNNYNMNAPRRFHRYSMIKDGLSIADKKLYELAAFFGPGKYIIPDDKKEVAYTMFSPLVDSLREFSNKYSDVPQTASIIVNGFADATGISQGSNLYEVLASALKKTSPSKAELNLQLSQFRAEAIANAIDTLVLRKNGEFKAWNNFMITCYEYGQGETLPTKTIKDYTDNDERRRVVLIYWSVLPENEEPLTQRK